MFFLAENVFFLLCVVQNINMSHLHTMLVDYFDFRLGEHRFPVWIEICSKNISSLNKYKHFLSHVVLDRNPTIFKQIVCV